MLVMTKLDVNNLKDNNNLHVSDKDFKIYL